MAAFHHPLLTTTTLLLFLTFSRPASSLPLINTTIPLPLGSTTHSTPGLLCTPTTALDLLTFYLLNYVAHAATVLTRPGERADDYAAAVIGALLFPALGLYRGIDAILSGAVWVRNDDLRKAARSGALCFVVRGVDWTPKDADGVEGGLYRGSSASGSPSPNTPDTGTEIGKEEEIEKPGVNRRSLTGSTLTCSSTTSSDTKDKEQDKKTHIIPFSPPYISTHFGHPVFAHRRIIHGTHVLPPGYRFAILPPRAALAPPSAPSSSPSPSSPQDPNSNPNPAPQTELNLSAQTSTLKAFIALLQSAYALSTLYRARGDQITQFGFSAFGLTVAPYAVMSIMNLLGNVCRPEYASLYMVGGSVMEEARGRGGVFEGVVGRVVEEEMDGEGEGEGIGAVRCGSGMEEVEEVGRVRFEVESVRGSGSAEETEKVEVEKKEKEDGKDAEEEEDEDNITAYFTTGPQTSTTSTLTTHVDSIAPLPKKLNYKGTDHSALLLIPSHPPFKLTTTTPTPLVATPPSSLKTLKLDRMHSFSQHYTWTPTFTPTALSLHARRWRWTKYLLLVLISLLPLVITGVMSGFRSGSIPKSESSTWSSYTGQWLGCGVATGLWWVIDQEGKEALPSVRGQVGPALRIWLYLSSASPAVGGFVVVGQMLFRYGSCIWVGD